MKNLLISILFISCLCLSACSQKQYVGTVRQTDRIKSVFAPDKFVLVLEKSDKSVVVIPITETLYYSIQAGEKVKIWREPIAGAVSKVEILK
jgi:hypothetical protein